MSRTLAKITNVESDGRWVWISSVVEEVEFYYYQQHEYYPCCRGCARNPHIRLSFDGGGEYSERHRKNVYWCQNCLPSKWRRCIRGVLALAPT